MASRIVQYFADKLKTVKEYPITLTKAVYDENGKRLDNKLQEIDNSINDVNNSLETKLNSTQLIVSSSQLSGNFVFDNQLGIQIFLLTLGENVHLVVVNTQRATSSFSQDGIIVTDLTGGKQITGVWHIFGSPSGKYRLKVNTSVNTDVAMCLIPLRPNFKVSSVYTSAT